MHKQTNTHAHPRPRSTPVWWRSNCFSNTECEDAGTYRFHALCMRARGFILHLRQRKGGTHHTHQNITSVRAISPSHSTWTPYGIVFYMLYSFNWPRGQVYRNNPKDHCHQSHQKPTATSVSSTNYCHCPSASLTDRSKQFHHPKPHWSQPTISPPIAQLTTVNSAAHHRSQDHALGVEKSVSGRSKRPFTTWWDVSDDDGKRRWWQWGDV